MNKRLLLVLLAFALAASFVSAQTSTNFLEPVFRTIDGMKIAENYAKYPYAIDFIIALFIFIGTAQTVLKDRLGKPATVGIGLTLSVALVSYEVSTGGAFRLGAFGAFAALLIVLIMGVFMFMVIYRVSNRASAAGSIAFLVTFLALQAVAPDFFRWLEQRAPLLYGILMIIFTFAFFTGLWSIGRFFMQGGGGQNTTPVTERLRNLFSPNHAPQNPHQPQHAPADDDSIHLLEGEINQYSGMATRFETDVRQLEALNNTHGGGRRPAPFSVVMNNLPPQDRAAYFGQFNHLIGNIRTEIGNIQTRFSQIQGNNHFAALDQPHQDTFTEATGRFVAAQRVLAMLLS